MTLPEIASFFRKTPCLRAWRLVAAIPLTVALSSCESINAYSKFYKSGSKIDTGVVDYRYADPETGVFSYHFFPHECVGDPQRDGCEVNIPDRYLLKAEDSVSVNLLYGLICDFYERAETPRELDRDYGEGKPPQKICVDIKENRAGTRGEISVLATVFERGGTQKIVRDTDEIGDKNARVIYYSQDVRETGQPFNLSNIPIYGPVTYNGKPFFIRFMVVELDQAEVEETGVILSSLAELGAVAYPPASPVLEALDKVGDAFLQSQQDDLVMDYEMVLDGEGGISPVSAPFAAGLYSFVRMQDRLVSFNWDDHCLDKTTGRIHAYSGSDECDSAKDELLGYTYFTVQIKRNESALEKDVYQSFAEFKQTEDDNTQSVTAIGEAFDKLKGEVVKKVKYDKARSLASDLASTSKVKKDQAQQAFKGALCAGDGHRSGFDDSDRLSDEKLYRLLEMAEMEGGANSVDPQVLKANYTALCASNTDPNWANVFP